MFFTRRLLEFLDRVTKPVIDLFEKIEVTVAGERWWVVGPKGTGKTVLHKVLSGEPVGDVSYTASGVDDKSGGGIYSSSKTIVRHKDSHDYGGEFLETWEEDIYDHQRFVFVYSLNDLDGSGCYNYNADAMKASERYSLNRDDVLYENIMSAFTLAISIISDNYTADSTLPDHKRKLLVLCNKTDLWPSGYKAQFFQPYKDIVQDMKKEAAALEVKENARFQIMYEACSLTSHIRVHFDAIMAKFLNKV